MNDNKIISLIENCNDEELEILITDNQIKSIPMNKIQYAINTNENIFKNILLDNTNLIIKLFVNTKNVPEQLQIFKKNIETINSQMLILKKKYIEPYEKLNKNIKYKKCIDNTIELFEKVKNFKNDVKILRVYFDKDNPLSDSYNSTSNFLKVKKELTNNLKSLNYINNEIDWFSNNEERMINFFRSKFHESIEKMDNNSIVKYLDLFSGIGNHMLINEIKVYSNKILKELMIEKFFKKLIQNNINPINSIDLISDNIVKIRKDIKEFFSDLEKWTIVIKNLGNILHTNYDRNNLVVYDDIMETEGLKNIADLFVEKIQSSYIQIFEKLKLNKNQNSLNYFVKDFLFFYFTVKKFSISTNITQIHLDDLKNIFIEKLKIILTENFNRAFNLIKSVEKNSEINGSFSKENIVNVKIIEHLVNYIRDMSMTYLDLSDEFENDILSNDLVLKQMSDIFSHSIIDNYFSKIFSKIENVLINLATCENEQLNVHKFYFFYFIVFKMNDVFISFQNSNINFLINDEIHSKIVYRLESYMNQFFTIFLNKIKEVKHIFVNKDVTNMEMLLNNMVRMLKIYFGKENYNSNKNYEKNITKFVVYIYLFIISVLLINMELTENEFNSLDEFTAYVNECSGLKKTKFFDSFYCLLKKLLIINDKISLKNIKFDKEIFLFMQNIRLIHFHEECMMNHIKVKKINIDLFCRFIGLILTNYFKIHLNELILIDNQISYCNEIKQMLFNLNNQIIN